MSKNDNIYASNRNIGLDIFRIIAVFHIFLFHSNIHLKCNYGFLDSFIHMGAIYMSAFFILSGYALYLVWSSKDLLNISVIKNFYIKRLIGIMPLYYFVSVIYIIVLGEESIFQNLIVAPAEFLGIQSVFSSLFAVSHNGGTWFVSCILMCYLIYQFIQELVKQIRVTGKFKIIALSVFILLYSPFVVHFFYTNSIYTNPFFRILEFMIGSILCSLMNEIKNKDVLKLLFSWQAIVIEYFLLILGVTLAVRLKIEIGNYMMYNWISLPIFMLQILSMAGIKWSNVIISFSKPIRYLSDISYAFFFGQFFTWKTTIYVKGLLNHDSNLLTIAISFLVCMLYSVLLHEVIQKPINRIIKKRLNKQ